MPISFAIGIGSVIADVATTAAAAIGTGIADIGAALAPEAAAAEIGGDVAAATAIPSAAEATATAADIAAATGGAALPAIEVGPTAIGAAEGALTGAEGAGAALATGGVTAIPETIGAGVGGGAIAATEALAGGGAGGALAALSPSDVVGGDFAAMSAAGIGPSVDLTAPALAGGDVIGTGAGDTALAFTTGANPGAIDPLANVGGGGGGGLATDPFSGAPAATSDLATALNTGAIGEQGLSGGETGISSLLTPGGLQAETAATGIPTPAAPAPEIPATISAPTVASSATPGASDINAIAASTGALPPGTSLTGANVSGGLSNLLSGSTLRTASLLAPLAMIGTTLARGQPGLPPAEQQALNNLGPAQNLANQQLQEGASGQLTPSQIAQIDQYKRNAKNQLYQLFASSGRNPQGDTDYIQGLATIDANALTMQQQFIDSAIKNGLAAQGVVDNVLQSAASLQVQQDQAFQASLNSAMSSFGLVAALNVASSRTT